MSESKSGYILNDGEVSNKSEAASCVNYRLSPEEREIIIIMDDKDRKWKASCSSPTYMRKFEKQGWTCTGEEHYRDGAICTKYYEAPTASSITIGKAERPRRQGKPMTEEHKRKLQEGRAAKKLQDSI